VLGSTGRNFAAGMSGGVAYVLDEQSDFTGHCNKEMVALEPLDETDKATLKTMIEKHEAATGSARAAILLINWKVYADRFVKVMPMDYKRVLQALERAKAGGLSGDEAMAAAFEENSHVTGH